VIVEQALDQLARAAPVAGREQEVGELAAGRRIVGVELDRAGSARRGRRRGSPSWVASWVRCQQIAAQPAGLLGGPAQLVEHRREGRRGLPGRRCPSTARPARARRGCSPVSAARASRYSLLGALGVAERDAEVGGVRQPARALPCERRPRGGIDQQRQPSPPARRGRAAGSPARRSPGPGRVRRARPLVQAPGPCRSRGGAPRRRRGTSRSRAAPARGPAGPAARATAAPRRRSRPRAARAGPARRPRRGGRARAGRPRGTRRARRRRRRARARGSARSSRCSSARSRSRIVTCTARRLSRSTSGDHSPLVR